MIIVRGFDPEDFYAMGDIQYFSFRLKYLVTDQGVVHDWTGQYTFAPIHIHEAHERYVSAIYRAMQFRSMQIAIGHWDVAEAWI